MNSHTHRTLLLIFFYTIVHGLCASQPRQKAESPSQIDSVGPFHLQYRMALSKHRRIVSRMEEFVWSHWTTKRAGLLTYRFVTLEGARLDFSMFVEKDEEEVWRVRIERKELRSSIGPILRSTKFAYSLQRVDVKKPVGDDYLPFSPSENPLPGTYILDFRDKEGKVIGRWEPDDTTR